MKKQRMTDSMAFKSLTGIVLLLVFFSVIIGIIGYKAFSEAILDQYADGAFVTADSASLLVDADRIDALAESSGETEEYKETWKAVDELCNSHGATFVYVIQPDLTDYAHITFLISTMNRESSYDLYDFGYVRETTNDEYREKYRKLYEGGSDRELVVRDRGYIETDPHITAMVPLKDSTGKVKAILCVQRQMDKLVQVRHSYVRKLFIALLVIMILLIIVQWQYLSKVLITPVEKEKERLATELDLAAKIQKEMLPCIFPPFPDRKEFSLYATMDPAREIGGDFYDFFLVDDDHLCLVIADVSGKGVPAALFMMATKIMISDNVKMGKSPAEVLETMNKAICENNKEKMFVTVWLGILEISTGKLTAANAGHEYPVLKRAGEDYELLRDAHSFVIGGMKNVMYKEYKLDLEKGSRLFLYTDGVPEATDRNNNMFGTDRMLAVLNDKTDKEPEEMIKAMRKAASDFTGDVDRFDDMTMLMVEYSGGTDSITLDATVENIDAVTDFIDAKLEEAGASSKSVMQINIVIDEVFSNIAKYAYPSEKGQATVELDISEDPLTAEITFIDSGVQYDPLSEEDPDTAAAIDDRPVGGLGILIVKKTMDEVTYEYTGGQNILHVKKKL